MRGALQSGASFEVGTLGRDFRRLRLRQQTLVLNDEEGRRRADFELGLFRLQRVRRRADLYNLSVRVAV